MHGPESPREDDFMMGDWRVLPDLNRIQGPDGETQLEPRTMSVLLVLTQHAGQVVSRQRLHELAWRGVTVSDETLNRAVFDLRKILGDQAAKPAYIETIRKVGYRLIAPVRSLPEPTATASPDDPSLEKARRNRSTPPVWAVLSILGVVGLLWFGHRQNERKENQNFSASPRTRQLTSYPGYETHPSISRDGTRLAFSWDGGETNNVDIYWHPIDDQTPVRLTEDPRRDDNTAWAPDGQRIAFIRHDADRCAVMLVTVASRQVQQLAECREAGISPPVWAADGRALIFSDRDAADEPFRLHRLDLDTARSTRLSSPPFGSLGDLYPAISPSGQRLAFVRATAKSTISTYLSPAIGDLYLLDLDSGETPQEPPSRLTFDNQIIAGLTWTQSADALAYVSKRQGRGYSLWKVAASGGDPRLILESDGLLRFPNCAGAGRLAYEQWQGRTDLWQLPLLGEPAPAAARVIQASTRSDLNPRWRPDGRAIAFTSARTGNYEIWVSAADGSEPRQLTFFVDSPVESPAWSPDGRQLVFEARRDGHSHLYLIDADGGEVTPLTATLFDDRAPAWSVDGLWIYFGSNRSGSWQIWKMAEDGTEITQITRNGGFRALESDHSDPPTLYYSKRDEGGLWQHRESSDDRLVAALVPEHWGNWDIVDGTLYFVELQGRTTRIKSLDLTTGDLEAVRIAGVAKDWISRETPNLSISPDGTSALFARFTGLAADLLIADYGSTELSSAESPAARASSDPSGGRSRATGGGSTP